VERLGRFCCALSEPSRWKQRFGLSHDDLYARLLADHDERDAIRLFED